MSKQANLKNQKKLQIYLKKNGNNTNTKPNDKSSDRLRKQPRAN